MAIALEEMITSKVQDFITSPRQMLIGGKWSGSASGKTFPVYDPATGEVIAQVAEGDSEDIEQAVKAARKAFESGPWPNMTPSERGKIIWKVGDLILQHADELAELESVDNGKPKKIARVADIPLAADLFHYMAGWATKIPGDTLPFNPAYHAYTLREPVGVVGQIIPWNFPLLMAAWKLGPALTTGNCVVLKPAEQTPLSALRLGELLQEAGVPNGVVNIVPGYGETAGAALAAHAGVDKVAFTGSTEVGKLIVKAAAGNLKKVSLELGGKSPNVLFKDIPDLDAAIAGAASAIFFNHGQCCCAGSRLYIEHDIYDQVLEGISSHAKNITVGMGLDDATDMGPLVSEEQFERVTNYLMSGLSEGATTVCGGNRVGDKGYFVEPTVLTNTRPDMKIVQEEIFGPVVVAERFTDLETVVPAANDTNYGLAAGIWTPDISKAHKVARQLRAGTVWVNCYNVFDASLPFGGYKESGWGREMGHEALELYTETKAVVIGL